MLFYFQKKYNFYVYKKKLGSYRWEANISLREDIQTGGINWQRLGMLSLMKYDKSFSIVSKLLKKDIHEILEYPEHKWSFLYKILCNITKYY
ncbi:hypothetical protein FACS1894110_25140 [Spirochaetia bacterium]|nr:hypothetical protein FACS1894110_25140 [Spirochaetia bacterium]